MKLKYLASLVLTLALFSSCEEDRRNANLYDSAVYFVNNATAGVCDTETMYDVQTTVEHPVYVYVSGFFGGQTTVSMSVDEEFINTYNESENTNLKALPSNCYTLSKTSATTENRKAKMSVQFDVEALKALSNEADFSDLEGYVVPLVLKPTGDIGLSTKDDMLSYELIQPVLKQATMAFSLTSDIQVSGNSYTMSMKSMFNNQFDLAWDIEFESASFESTGDNELTTLGNTLPAKYAMKGLPLDYISNKDMKTLASGENEVDYTITLPNDAPYGNYYLNVKVKNCTLDGITIPLESGEVNANIKLVYSPNVSTPSTVNVGLKNYFTAIPQSSMTFYAESYHGTSYSSALDGNTGTIWENRYGSNGAGIYTIPFLAVLDLGEAKTISVLEVWRRNHSTYVTDLREFEVYAAESVSVNNNGNEFGYSGLTYLGNIDFGSTKDIMMFATLDKAETRYLVFKFIKSNRGACISFAELGAWY